MYSQDYDDSLSYLDNSDTCSEYTNVAPSKQKKAGRWTNQEDNLLFKYVPVYGERQWHRIAKHVPGRNSIQCLHRWTKILKPGLVKGMWTPEEDEALAEWIEENGPNKWSQCALSIEGRSGKQCRDRWFNHLSPEVKKGSWSVSEDKLIFDLYQKYGSSWSKIAKHVPNRTENSIKNRFYSTLRKIANDRRKAKDPKKAKKLMYETNSHLYKLLEKSSQSLDESDDSSIQESTIVQETQPLKVRGQKYVITKERCESTTSEGQSIVESEEEEEEEDGDQYEEVNEKFDSFHENTTDNFEKLSNSILNFCQSGVNNLTQKFEKVSPRNSDSSTKAISFEEAATSDIPNNEFGVHLRRSKRIQTRATKESNRKKQVSMKQRVTVDAKVSNQVYSHLEDMTSSIQSSLIQSKLGEFDFEDHLSNSQVNTNSTEESVDCKAEKLCGQLDWLESMLTNTHNELTKITGSAPITPRDEKKEDPAKMSALRAS